MISKRNKYNIKACIHLYTSVKKNKIRIRKQTYCRLLRDDTSLNLLQICARVKQDSIQICARIRS